jgi:hypothetical protein
VVTFLKDSICLLFAGEYDEDVLQEIVQEYAQQMKPLPLNDGK